MNFEQEISDERSKLYESIISQKKSLLSHIDQQEEVLLTLKSKMNETIVNNNYVISNNNEGTPDKSVKNEQYPTSDGYNSSQVNTATRNASALSSTHESILGDRLYQQGLNSFDHKKLMRKNYNEELKNQSNVSKILPHSSELIQKKTGGKNTDEQINFLYRFS